MNISQLNGTSSDVEMVTKAIFGDEREYVDYKLIERILKCEGTFEDLALLMRSTPDLFSASFQLIEEGKNVWMQCTLTRADNGYEEIGDLHADAGIALISAYMKFQQ